MRESDIRPAELLDEYLRLSALDAVRLFAAEDTREIRSCPGCGGGSESFQYRKNGFDLVTCDDCSTLFVNPAPSEKALESLYADSPSADFWANNFMPAVLESRRQKIFKPRAKIILDIISELGGSTSSIVDVGAGAGLLIEELQRLAPDARIRAIEPGVEQAACLNDKGIEAFQGYVSDLVGDRTWSNSADLVVCCELIEHITDTNGFIEALSSLVKAGGHIVITGLCASGFDIELLKEHSNAVSPPHHLTFLSRRGAESLVERSGLELVSFETPGKLDVDIVKCSLKNNPDMEIDSFLQKLMMQSDQEILDSLQQFLSANGLSSHMWMVIRNSKPNVED